MKKYEYISYSRGISSEKLNELGRLGWKLSIIEGSFYIFSREIPIKYEYLECTPSDPYIYEYYKSREEHLDVYEPLDVLVDQGWEPILMSPDKEGRYRYLFRREI